MFEKNDSHKPRRLVRVPISHGFIERSVRAGQFTYPSVVIDGIPQDAELVAISADYLGFYARGFDLLYEHESFKEVLPGENIPQFFPTLHSVSFEHVTGYDFQNVWDRYKVEPPTCCERDVSDITS